ncbi:MAG: tetratricopeptide repeat protein [Tidjanibacter sp.]|nr:tetratricopeptide repeat protein [Tidjanibacter sp.]
MSRIARILLVVVALVGATATARGQMFPERRHIRKGNEHYEGQRMADSQKEYLAALLKDTLSVAANFNLGDALYATGDYAAAEEQFARVAQMEGATPEQRASAYYNLGNAQFQQQKLQEALGSYKESLKLRPEDLEAKFNYAYTKELLKEQEQNQDQNKDQNQQQNQDQNQQQNQDQNQDQNRDNSEGENDQQQQPNEPEEGEGEQQPQNPEGDKPQPSEQPQAERPEPRPESQQMLDAVQAAEDKTREKVDEKRAVGVAASGKNW